jgi:hypothetical protein
MKRFLINDQGLQENLLTPSTAIINLSSLRFKPRTVQRHVPSQKSPLPPFGKVGFERFVSQSVLRENCKRNSHCRINCTFKIFIKTGFVGGQAAMKN